MAFRRGNYHLTFVSAVALAVIPLVPLATGSPRAFAQVFVVGEKSAMAGVSTDFHPTRVELSAEPITERGRRDLVRNLEAEQGFAHRPLPLADTVVLMANGKMSPSGDAYNQLLYKKGQFAAPGDRVAITRVAFDKDSIVIDINGGRYLKHRFLRHIQLNDVPLVADDGAQVTGCRVNLVFEGGIPEISAPVVKALLDPIIDFGVKTSAQAYATTLPAFLKEAIDQHDVLVGMDRRMVLAAKGAPESKIRELEPGSTDQHYEEWMYGQVPQTVYFVRFIGDHVVQVRVAALGQPVVTRNRNEMQGFSDQDDTHEIAMGDTKSTDPDAPTAAPPTILKPGEVAPGSSRRVLVPPPDDSQNKSRDPSASSSPGGAQANPPGSTDPQSAPAPDSKLAAPRQVGQ